MFKKYKTMFKKQILKAIDEDDSVKVSNLLDKILNVNYQNSEGETLLHYACKRDCSIKVLSVLIQRGFFIFYYFYYFIFFYFLFLFYLTLKIKLKKGASVNIENLKGETPFHFNCFFSLDEEKTQFLLLNGANLLKLDQLGSSPLHFSCCISFSFFNQ